MRCLLFIARFVSFVESNNPFLSSVSPAELMPMSLCEIGRIELEGGYVVRGSSLIMSSSVITRVVGTGQCGGRKGAKRPESESFIEHRG